MKSILTDIRFGFRGLLKNPAFTAVAVLTLALGVGANTALFSVVDAMLLKKLPVKDPNRLVLLKASWGQKFSPGSYDGSNMRDPATGLTVGTSFPMQTVMRLREEQGVLSDVFAFSPMDVNFNAGGQAEVVTAQAVSGNYYTALGVPAMIGRTITDADDNAAALPSRFSVIDSGRAVLTVTLLLSVSKSILITLLSRLQVSLLRASRGPHK